MTCISLNDIYVILLIFILDEEEVIVLEVAERAKMVAQQNGHDFALGHLPFTVSHALISLVDGCEMEAFSEFSI